jgi:hypothetical protein
LAANGRHRIGRPLSSIAAAEDRGRYRDDSAPTSTNPRPAAQHCGVILGACPSGEDKAVGRMG